MYAKMTSRMFVLATLLSVNVLTSNTYVQASGSCRVQQGATSIGTPTFRGQPQTTYSCIADENCNYDVHIVGNYEGNGHLGFRIHHTGNTSVNIRVSGEGSKPLVLVFVSYVNWILNIPSGVVIDQVLLGSHNLSGSYVSGYTSQNVLSVERVPYSQLPYAYSSGGRIDEVLSYITGRFGPVASFSGSYRADTWTLNIQQNTVPPDCQQISNTATEQVAATSLTPSSSSEIIPPDTPEPDSSGSCHVQQGATSIGTPTFRGQPQTTYSCIANENCNYDVHIVGNYEGNSNHGFRYHPTGNTSVNIGVRGEGSKPLVLVFVSYEPVNWILSIPSGVVIDQVLLGSYYLSGSNVSGYTSETVLSVERVPYSQLPYVYSSGGRTDEVLSYVTDRFGPVASFSGSYSADTWTLNIQRNTVPPGCPGNDTSSPRSTSIPPLTSQEPISTENELCNAGTRCIEWNNQYICSGDYYTGSSCVGDYCRCVDNPRRDYCTCLYKSGECHIERGSSVSVGTPTFEGRSQTTYGCVANENCNNDVHVISNYEGNGHTGFRVHNTGNTRVDIRVSGRSSKPLILVFSSYEPVNWILNIPSGVVIDRILLGSYYLSRSNVSGYSPQSVLTVERVSSLPSGYGSDTGGGHTDQLLDYATGRFGPVASFTGSYSADSWTLNIQRNTVPPDCQQPMVSRPENGIISQVTGDLQLSNGCSGELLMYESLKSGQGYGLYTVCESNFSDANSKVVCRSLGCSIDGATSTMRVSQTFNLSSVSAHFYCYGYESSLSQCDLNSMGQCSSQSTLRVYVECSSNTGDTLKQKTSKIIVLFVFTAIFALM